MKFNMLFYRHLVLGEHIGSEILRLDFGMLCELLGSKNKLVHSIDRLLGITCDWPQTS